MDLMDCRAVVEALRAPAVLVGQDLRAVAYSPRWMESYGDAFTPFLAEPLSGLGALLAARGVLESGLETELVVPESDLSSEVERFEIRPVLARGSGRLAVIAGLLVLGVERQSQPAALVTASPRTEVVSSSAPESWPASSLVATSSSRELPAWRTPGPADPASVAYRLRTDLQDLVGHLEVLHASPLSRLQEDRVDSAVEKALGLVAYLGEIDWAEVASARVGRPTRRAPDARPLRALVVDDNSINRHVAQSMFGVLGVDADAVGDAVGAMAMLEATTYDLVFMDVMLPGVDGVEITQQIRQQFGAHPYVIGVTAMPEAEARCLEAGMDAFFVKPLRLDDVSRAVALCDEV